MMEALEAAVSAPAGAARALPFFAYRDSALFELEMERIFRGDWVAVCSAAALAAPGAYCALSIGREPVAVIRGEDGELRAVSNSCRHRGTQLLDAGHGEVSSIVCPYHAWAFGLDGHFRGAPMTGNVEIDPEAHGLPRFALEVWAGVVFVNVDGRAEPLRDRMAGAAPYLAPYGLERYDASTGIPEPQCWGANWKLAFENGIESYHLFKVHKDTLERVSPTRAAFYLEGSAHWTITAGALAGDATPHPGEPDALSDAERRRYVLVSIPPSFVAILTRDSWGWIAIHPTGPETCQVAGEALIPRAQLPAAGTASGYDDFTAAFLAEDRFICERGQQGIQARHSEGGQLVELERVVGDFHRYLGVRLFGRAPEPAHREPAPG